MAACTSAFIMHYLLLRQRARRRRDVAYASIRPYTAAYGSIYVSIRHALPALATARA